MERVQRILTLRISIAHRLQHTLYLPPRHLPRYLRAGLSCVHSPRSPGTLRLRPTQPSLQSQEIFCVDVHGVLRINDHLLHRSRSLWRSHIPERQLGYGDRTDVFLSCCDDDQHQSPVSPLLPSHLRSKPRSNKRKTAS